MLYSWQLTCPFGLAVAFAPCVSGAAGRRRILPFAQDWGAHSSRTLRTERKNPASARWRYWQRVLKSHFHSYSPDCEEPALRPGTDRALGALAESRASVSGYALPRANQTASCLRVVACQRKRLIRAYVNSNCSVTSRGNPVEFRSRRGGGRQC
jgi:hypothetical protein